MLLKIIMGTAIVALAVSMFALWIVGPPPDNVQNRDVLLVASCVLIGIGVSGVLMMVFGLIYLDWKDGLL